MKPRRKPAFRPLEKSVQKSVIAFLQLRGAFVIRTNSGGVKFGDQFVKFNSARGCSDLLVCYRGRWLALEVKRDEKAVPTDEQEAFLAEVKRAGGVAQVVRSIDDAKVILDQIDIEEEV